jgi:hypothetical protein
MIANPLYNSLSSALLSASDAIALNTLPHWLGTSKDNLVPAAFFVIVYRTSHFIIAFFFLLEPIADERAEHLLEQAVEVVGEDCQRTFESSNAANEGGEVTLIEFLVLHTPVFSTSAIDLFVAMGLVYGLP